MKTEDQIVVIIVILFIIYGIYSGMTSESISEYQAIKNYDENSHHSDLLMGIR